jgi:hypothetical protein
MAKDWLFAIFSMRRDPERPTKIATIKNMKYLLQNGFVFCDSFCAGKRRLSRFQRVYVRSI